MAFATRVCQTVGFAGRSLLSTVGEPSSLRDCSLRIQCIELHPKGNRCLRRRNQTFQNHSLKLCVTYPLESTALTPLATKASDVQLLCLGPPLVPRLLGSPVSSNSSSNSQRRGSPLDFCLKPNEEGPPRVAAAMLAIIALHRITSHCNTEPAASRLVQACTSTRLTDIGRAPFGCEKPKGSIPVWGLTTLRHPRIHRAPEALFLRTNERWRQATITIAHLEGTCNKKRSITCGAEVPVAISNKLLKLLPGERLPTCPTCPRISS